MEWRGTYAKKVPFSTKAQVSHCPVTPAAWLWNMSAEAGPTSPHTATAETTAPRPPRRIARACTLGVVKWEWWKKEGQNSSRDLGGGAMSACVCIDLDECLYSDASVLRQMVAAIHAFCAASPYNLTSPQSDALHHEYGPLPRAMCTPSMPIVLTH